MTNEISILCKANHKKLYYSDIINIPDEICDNDLKLIKNKIIEINNEITTNFNKLIITTDQFLDDDFIIECDDVFILKKKRPNNRNKFKTVCYSAFSQLSHVLINYIRASLLKSDINKINEVIPFIDKCMNNIRIFKSKEIFANYVSTQSFKPNIIKRKKKTKIKKKE
jgi:hypothetical protein